MIHMRNAIGLVLITLAPGTLFAAPPDRFCFVGEVRLSSPDGKAMGSQAIFVEKIHDPDNATIIEHAIVIQPNGKVEEYTMKLTVKVDNTFTLSDDAKTVEGTGKLFGPQWKWTYFKATFKTKNGVTIEDENFMADDSIGTARKKVIAPNDKVIMYMDMSLKGITPKTFEILRAGLVRK